jgi:cell division protein YceG involved in septum cleavage
MRPLHEDRPLSSVRLSGGSRFSSGGLIVALVAIVLLVGCGIGGVVVLTDLNQPVADGNVACKSFTVNPGDSASTIIDHLEQANLIRNALIFKLYLKLNGKNINAQPGTYCISPSMHLGDIAAALNTPPNTAYVQFYVPEGDRLIQYPGDILASAVLHDPGKPDDGAKGAKALPNFTASDFLNITVKTGTFSGSDHYWYVQSWKAPSLTKLEGYLSPNTYQVAAGADATAIIKTMLNGLGEQLCPGPSGAIDMYIFDKAQCMAHGATITVPASIPGAGKAVDVFTALKKYDADPVVALQKALIIGSLAQRESRTKNNFYEVASVYYDRYAYPNAEGTNGLLQGDPAEQYWLGATGSNPWPNLVQALNGVGPGDPSVANNPYNLYKTPGLPPSAIAGMSADALLGGIDPPNTGWFFFFHGCDGSNHYEKDYTTNLNDEAKYGVC